MTEDFSVNEREEPAPAITDAQCLAAMRECAAQKGESHEAMWSQMDAQVRAEVLGEWRAILECAGVAGRSPAEVPPNWPEDVQEARNVVIEQGGHALCRELSELESCDFVPLVDALCAAVWRSAQQ